MCSTSFAIRKIAAVIGLCLFGCGGNEKAVEKGTPKTNQASDESPELNGREANDLDVPGRPSTLGPLRTDLIHPYYYVGVVLRPAAILAKPEFKNGIDRANDTMARFQKKYGFDPRKVDRALVGFDPKAGAASYVVELFQPYDRERVLQTLLGPQHTHVDINGKTVFKEGRLFTGNTVYFPDEKTVAVSFPGAFEYLLGETATSGTLAKRLQELPLDREVVGTVVSSAISPQLRESFKKDPPNAVFLHALQVADFTNSIDFSIDVSKQRTDLAVAFHSDSAEDAIEVDELVSPLVKLGINALQTELTKLPPQFHKQLQRILDGVKVELTDKRLDVTASIDPSGAKAIAEGVILPELELAQHRIRLLVQKNKLHQVSIAMHNYYARFGSLPVANDSIKRDEHGKPLLSWRVHLLPFLEQHELYARFKLDEPWDSPHNRQLIPKMPNEYSSDYGPGKGQTNLQAPLTRNSVFGGNQTIKFNDIPDGGGSTVAFILTKPEYAVPWTKPADCAIDQDDPAASIYSSDGIKTICLFVNGSVHFLRIDLDAEVWLALFGRNDGKNVNSLKK